MNSSQVFFLVLTLICHTSKPSRPDQISPSETTSNRGHVLLFAHGELIEGEIEQLGDRFRVRHKSGEMVLPASPTTLLLPDKTAAYEVMRQRINLNDVRQRLALSRWCLRNGLKAEAIKETEAALQLAPQDNSIMRFKEFLESQTTPPVPAPDTPVTHEVSNPNSDDPIVTTELPPTAHTLFTSKVQPILVNSCAGCHCRPEISSFRLTRPTTMFGDRWATQRNLAAVLAVIDREQPLKSSLLIHSLTVHGGATTPPLRHRESTAYRYLEEFVRLVAGQTSTPPSKITTRTELPQTVQSVNGSSISTEPRRLPEIRVTTPLVTQPFATTKAEPGAIAPMPNVDEFDPTPFNRANTETRPGGK
jgi:hypothetical protein